jgi:hypothetical protein
MTPKRERQPGLRVTALGVYIACSCRLYDPVGVDCFSDIFLAGLAETEPPRAGLAIASKADTLTHAP